MQNLCHTSRAYIINEGFLHGFCNEFNVIKQLKIADRNNTLAKVVGYQHVDIKFIEKRLADFTEEERAEKLKAHYPRLYLFSLEFMDRREEAEEFSKQCLEYRDKDWENYSYYVHGYLLPMLEKLREEGKLIS